jgi:hypothetical protein
MDQNVSSSSAAAGTESSSDDPWNCKWETGIMYDYVGCRSSIIKANINGIETSFAYRVKRYLGFEADATTAFGSPIFVKSIQNWRFLEEASS